MPEVCFGSFRLGSSCSRRAAGRALGGRTEAKAWTAPEGLI